MSSSYWSVDRPRFYALVISCIGGGIFELPGVEHITTSKGDDGNAGTFSFRVPVTNVYDPSYSTFGSTQQYGKLAMFMDLVAIYATRERVDAQGVITGPVLRTPLDGLQYGGDAAATVKALGTDSCLMVGMVDSIFETSSPDSPSVLQFTGRDLTKIFLINDIAMPDSAFASTLLQYNVPSQGNTGSNNPFNLQTVLLTQEKFGPPFLLDVLDLLVGKDLSSLNRLTPTANPKTDDAVKANSTIAWLNSAQGKSAQAAYKAFGYPWRDFVRTDDAVRFNSSYLPLVPGSYPPYQPQAGAVWASILELRNPPLSRIFVDERGQLVFDDQYIAWTSQASAGDIEPQDIRSFEGGIDDADWITFVSVVPSIMSGAAATLPYIKGDFNQDSGFVDGVMKASNIGDAQVQTFGYRYGQFESIFDLSYAAAAKRIAVVLQAHNNPWSASVVLRGDPRYRVGTRWRLMWTSSRAEMTNATWYVTHVQHDGEFGSDFTTTLQLRFPQMTVDPGPLAVVPGADAVVVPPLPSLAINS